MKERKKEKEGRNGQKKGKSNTRKRVNFCIVYFKKIFKCNIFPFNKFKKAE